MTHLYDELYHNLGKHYTVEKSLSRVRLFLLYSSKPRIIAFDTFYLHYPSNR